MENETEGLEPQKIQEQEMLTPEEISDLKHRAEVSSQNFERAKKAEAALKELENNNKEVTADKGLHEDVKMLKDKLAKQEVLEANPQLKDKWKEFDEFRQLEDNKGMSLKTAAKSFLIENGLLEVRRQGLESKTGGDREPIKTGMTPEDAEKLRVTNWKVYQEKLMRGEIPSAQ